MIDTTGTLQLPPQASTIAPQVDALYYFIFWGSVFFFSLIVGLCVIFAVRYRRREGDQRLTKTHHNTPLEIAWSVIPLALVIVVFVWGFRGYMALAIAPGDSLEYYVTGKRWLRQVTHPNGEVDLCFTVDGNPTFDGNAPGWTVYEPGSWHVPSVADGVMDILYFLPGGAIKFGPKEG